MPNTTPTIDNPDRVNYVHNKAAQVSGIHVLQAGAATKGEKGTELSDIAGMVKAGIPAVSEDGKSVMNTALCKEAMKIAAECGVPFFDHCEDIDLRGDGCMNDDEKCQKTGASGNLQCGGGYHYGQRYHSGAGNRCASSPLPLFQLMVMPR